MSEAEDDGDSPTKVMIKSKQKRERRIDTASTRNNKKEQTRNNSTK